MGGATRKMGPRRTGTAPDHVAHLLGRGRSSVDTRTRADRKARETLSAKPHPVSISGRNRIPGPVGTDAVGVSEGW